MAEWCSSAQWTKYSRPLRTGPMSFASIVWKTIM
jgi:hypothetical protein